MLEGLLLLSLVSVGNQQAATVDLETPDEPTAIAARPALALGAMLAYFAIYVGVEVSVGQWSFSVLTEERGYGPGLAGVAVATYWGGLTAGRLALGVVGDRIAELTLLRGSAIGW